jgi:hypothetical protein
MHHFHRWVAILKHLLHLHYPVSRTNHPVDFHGLVQYKLQDSYHRVRATVLLHPQGYHIPYSVMSSEHFDVVVPMNYHSKLWRYVRE